MRCAVISSCKHHTNGHSFWQVMDGDSKGKHRRLRQMRVQTLWLVRADMQVWCQFIDE